MQSDAITVDEYIESLPEDRKEAITKIRNLLKDNLPEGFEEQMSYGMPGFVVPFSIYLKGYQVDSRQPLPFISYASQKNHIAIYHMAIYSDKEILNWLTDEYSKHSNTKLDMGKSCIRFKNLENIPFGLIAELASKITVKEWIKSYEETITK